MNNFTITVLAAGIALSLSGCGQAVEVPVAHVGKVMTMVGYKEGTISTSRFRLDPCLFYCDKLVVLDVSDRSVSERMELFMPEDKLIMTVDLRMTLSVNPAKYEELYASVPPAEDKIEWVTAYNTYARDIVRAEAREFLSQFTIAKIASSREAINSQLSQRLSKSIAARTPFQVRYIGLADIQYPEVIVSAQRNAAERREMINQEEAQLAISKVQLERELQEQEMRRKIEVEKSRAEAEVNKILADSITPAYVQYKSLEIMKELAGSDNKVFVPASMLDTVAGQIQVGRN